MPHPWICPFCPLHCEDVKIERQAEGARMIAPECSLAQAAIKRLDLDRKEPRPSRIKGEIVDRHAAIQYVAERLNDASEIALRGSLTGLGTARSVLGFAERVGAAIDHDAFETQNALRRTVARDGVFSATLGDVRRYADLVVLIGRPEKDFPRLVDRFCVDGLIEGRSRQIVSLVPALADSIHREQASGIPTDASFERLTIAPERFSDFLAAIRVHIQGQAADRAAGLDQQTSAQLQRLTGWLDAANYVAVVLGPTALDAFGPFGAEVEAAGLIASIRAFNEERRAVLLSIDPSLSFRQAALWRSGFSGPVRWQQGVPGPLERGQFEALWESPGTVRLRIECSPGARFARSLSSGEGRATTDRSATARAKILLAVEGVSEEAVREADAFLPIAAPGIDLADAVVRGDGTVSLPLTSVRSPLEPSLAETLTALSEAGRADRGLAYNRSRESNSEPK
ncbi:MAG: hypothetical protein WD119_02000 [Pirellulaceae bacterium]